MFESYSLQHKRARKSSSANSSVLDVSLYMVMKRQIIWQCSPSKSWFQLGVGFWLFLSKRDQRAGDPGREGWAREGPGRSPTHQHCRSSHWVGGRATHCRVHKIAHHAVSTCVGKITHWATGRRTRMDEKPKKASDQISLEASRSLVCVTEKEMKM